MQQHLFEHFSEEWHHSFEEDLPITLIDKTDPSNPLQRENYWRSTLKTMAPWGLNVEDCVWNSVLLYSYQWIWTDCNKDLIYENDLYTDYYCFYFHHYRCCWRFHYTFFSLLLPFSLLFCFYCCYLRDCVGVLLVIIGVGVIVAAIVVIFVALLLLLLHHYLFFLTLVWYHHVFNVTIVIFVSLSFLLFYCCCFFVVVATVIIIAYPFLLL